MLTTAGCSENTGTNMLGDIKKAETITMKTEKNSLKGRVNISADGNLCAVKKNRINKSSGKQEYSVYSDNIELFRISETKPDGISDKTFDMYGVYENENTVGYIQSDVFRGNESYIIYNADGEKYAFCYVNEKPKYQRTTFNIISFDDELLYTLDMNVFEPESDITLKRARPDAEFDISAFALTFIINDHYAKLTEENK